jgi:hypothetical protein
MIFQQIGVNLVETDQVKASFKLCFCLGYNHFITCGLWRRF